MVSSGPEDLRSDSTGYSCYQKELIVFKKEGVLKSVHRRGIITVGLILGLAFSLGCSTVQGIKRSDEGKTYVFNDVSKDEVFQAASKIMTDRLAVSELNKEQGVIRGKSKTTGFSSGSVFGAFVTQLQEGTVELKIVQKRKIATQLSAGGVNDNDIVMAIRAELNQ